VTTSDLHEQRRQLAVEIFDLTGQKADPDDPFITAALFYSSKMSQSASEIRSEAEKARQSFADSLAELRKVSEEVQRSIPGIAAQAIATSAATATQQEMSKIKGNLTLFAEGLKMKLQSVSMLSIADSAAESQPSKSTVLAMPSTLVVMTLFGAIVGARAYGQPNLTPKQQKELQYGRMLADALPYLDKGTKEKLFAAMEKTMPKNKK
jgi:hypothetical protein